MPAPWFLRVVATIVDAVLVFIPLALTNAAGRSVHGGDGTAVFLVLGVAVLLVAVLYAPVFLARPGAVNGQTIGKQALGLRVVRLDGEAMTFGRGCLREVGAKAALGVVTGGLWTVVDSLWPLADGRRQALHDKLASTRVVRATPLSNLARHLPGATSASRE